MFQPKPKFESRTLKFARFNTRPTCRRLRNVGKQKSKVSTPTSIFKFYFCGCQVGYAEIPVTNSVVSGSIRQKKTVSPPFFSRKALHSLQQTSAGCIALMRAKIRANDVTAEHSDVTRLHAAWVQKGCDGFPQPFPGKWNLRISLVKIYVSRTTLNRGTI